MFVRVKKIGKYEYLYLVENAREGGRHVQRVVKALDVTLGGRRYVLCRNEEEARKDAERRAMLLAGLERKLKSQQRSELDLNPAA
jgi:hypothetical protein